MRPRAPLATRATIAAALLALAAASGCRNEMYDQPRFEPYEADGYFSDGTSARPLVPGTVARLDPKAEPRDQLYRADRLDDGTLVDKLPFPLTRDVLVRGRERYAIYCTPCHGQLGDGRGLIVLRGFSPPPSFHAKEVVERPLGHYFRVITDGHGAMYGYASRIPPRDRWNIAAYLRALQLSQAAPADRLAPADREALEALDREGAGGAESKQAASRESER
jgi:mono/diheme cytochrome c family protein